MITIVRTYVLPAACSLLPARMDTLAARAMLLAIGLQESRFEHRRQVSGPARGFFQFEAMGVNEVLQHPASRAHAERALTALCYRAPFLVTSCHQAIEHNDVLACVFARLLLRTLPAPLPDRHQPALAWRQYLDAWRPGKPHRDSWDAYYAQAWALADGHPTQDVSGHAITDP